LLKELVKRTDQHHIDYANLSEALRLVNAAASHINECVRKQQNNAVLVSLQEKFVTKLNIVQPGRELVYQGQLFKFGKNTNRHHQFFLFNDLLIFCNSIGWRYKIKKE